LYFLQTQSQNFTDKGCKLVYEKTNLAEILKNFQKRKRKILPLHAMKFHSFINSALDKGEWLTLRPGRINPGKEPRYPLNGRLGGPQRWFGRFGEEKNLLLLPGFQPWTVEPVVR
jgi:hypothetical protein